MPQNKKAYLRYRLICECLLRHKHRRCPFEEIQSYLLAKTEEEIKLTRSTFEKDLAELRSGVLGSEVPIAYDRPHGYYIDGNVDARLFFQINAEDAEAAHAALSLLKKYAHLPFLKGFEHLLNKFFAFAEFSRTIKPELFPNYVIPEQGSEEGLQWIGRIGHAIDEKESLNITYRAHRHSSEYTFPINPYLLKEHEGLWYLVARSIHDDMIRIYGLDRIQKIESSGESWVKPPDDLLDQLSHSIGISTFVGEPQTVRLWFSKQQAPYVLHDPWHPSQKVVEETADGIVVELFVRLNYELQRKILGCGPECRVLGPDELVESIRSLVTKMLL